MDDGNTANVRWRRGWAAVLFGAVLVAVSTMLLARWNPWRYVYLIPLADTGYLVMVLAATPALVAVAVHLTARSHAVRRAVAAVAAVVTIALCCAGWHFATAADFSGVDRNGLPTVVAISPDRSHDIVVIKHSAFMVGWKILRIRSRAGLLSRESGGDLACFLLPFDGAEKADMFGSARFVTPDEVEVTTADGQPWRTTFDPRTLRPAATLDRGCEPS